MSLIDAATTYQTRATLFPNIKKSRIRFFKNFFGGYEEGTAVEKEMTDKEFILLNTAFNLNLNYCTHILDLAFTHGAVNVVVSYLTVQLTLGIPIFMLYVFMSTYSKKSFIRFWDCAPMFEGIGYTLGICRFCIEIYNVTTACLSLILLFEVIHYDKRQAILTCRDAKKGLCMSIDSPPNMTNICNKKIWAFRFKNETVFIPLQYHFRYNVLKYDQFSGKCCTMNVKLVIFIIGAWFLIFILSVLDIDRINKVTANTKIVIIIVMSCVCVYSCIFMVVNDKPIMFSNFYSPAYSDLQFWVDMMHHGGETNILSNIIWLGSMRKDNSFPIHAVLIIAPLKLVATALMLCYSSRVSHDVVKHYKLKDSTCLPNSGTDFLLTFVPESLLRTRFGGLGASFWLLGLSFSSIITPIYSIIALVNTIIEKYNRMRNYRVLVYFTLCVIGMVLNLGLANNYILDILFVFRFHGLPLVRTIILVLVILALMFIYSTKRIIDDYSFMYSSPPHKYWIVFWRASPTFTLIAFIFTLYMLKVETGFISVYLVVGSYITAIIMLAPILLTLIIKCCIHVKYRTLGQLSRPAPSWGPYNPIQRMARKYFYPQRDVKYRNTHLKCMHKCIVRNQNYIQETHQQDIKRRKIIDDIQRFIGNTFQDLKEEIEEDEKEYWLNQT